MKVAVVDYGMGNLRSVSKAIEHVEPRARVEVTDDPERIAGADRVVFPGQGAMPDCMREMEARGLRSAVLGAARTRPFLGICIGLQMLFERSDEGGVAGLALLPGTVRRFPPEAMVDARGRKLKVPHMGWNRVRQTRPHVLWSGIEDGSRFYFVHSYFPMEAEAALVRGTTDYGIPFTCAVARDNIFAVQFHPEKSQTAGLQLLSNFLNWNP
jgi:imidazole glycerol-phosphate synthase subunit HisH